MNMETKNSKEKFRFDNLLFDSLGIITGPMGPISTAEGLAKQGVIPRIDGLVRVGFNKALMYQNLEGKGHTKEMTGHGAYIVKFEEGNARAYFFYIDLGARVLPIAIYDNFETDSKDEFTLTTTPIGEARKFEDQLSEDEIKEMIDQAIAEDAFKIQPTLVN